MGGPVDVTRQNGDCQSEVLAFLANPATHGGAPVRRIDTHSAAVFLAGDRAYKVKRAVRYSYLDFSTLALRRAACAAELEINRAFAPRLYLRVIPITREPNGALRLGGHGESVGWVVEMRRFDETRTLDRLADDNAIDLALADKLARAVAATHSRIPVLEGAPWIAALSSYIAENDAAFRADPDLFDPAQTGSLDRDSRLALNRLRPLLAARSAAGMVRRGHGDLHLGNVALLDGNPVLFDAVEFSPLIAAGDVLYYLAETRRMSDLDAVAALPFFMSLRAAIRANVTASRATIASKPDRAEARFSAKKYFALACRLIRPAPPVLVGIGGLSGTGKSRLAATLAPELAPAPGAIVLRSDVERKALQGRREDERLPPPAYTPESTARVYAMLVEKAGRVIAAGHSAIVDAVFARPQERDALQNVAQTRGVTFHGLFLTADMATRVARVGSRLGDASDADRTVARAQERYVLGHNDWRSIDASGVPECTLARACEVLA